MFWSPTVRTDHVKPPQQQHIKKKVSFVWINNSLKIELFLHGNNVLLAGHSHTNPHSTLHVQHEDT